jgi:hypothetical protein
MKEIDTFEVFKDRYLNKMTLKELSQKYGRTREWMRQITKNVMEAIFYDVEISRWKEKNKINEISDSALIQVVFLMGKGLKHKIIRLINAYEIEKPTDFHKHTPKELMSISSIDKIFFFHLKLALLKVGCPYDADNMQEIESKLISYSNAKLDGGLKLRFKILTRDDFECKYCGRSPRYDKNIILEVDHVHPVSKGGSWEESNLITACKECNNGKRDAILASRKYKAPLSC